MTTQTIYWVNPAQKPVEATVEVPGSKSITNRALLLAALAQGESRLSGVLSSDDSLVFIGALQSLGFDITYDEAAGTCRLVGSGGRIPSTGGDIWCGSAGTASRFLLGAVAAAGRGTYAFDATAQMRARPIGPLIDGLRAQGIGVTSDSFPLTMTTEGLAGGELALSGGETSSQYLSGMLMAAPLALQPMTVSTKVSVSRPFVDMTLRMMEAFGVTVQRDGYERFTAQGQTPYVGQEYVIEADASTASYFFAAAAVTGGRVRVAKVSRRGSLQGDIRFLDILEAMGCTVFEEPDGTGVTVQGPSKLRGVDVDMGDISDTMMSLATIAPFADGPTTIRNIAHVRKQESDRIAVVTSNLEKLGIRTEEGEDWLTVHPGTPQGGVIDPNDDHRMAMSFSVLGLAAPGIGISDPGCVSKTCPNFYELLESMYA